MDAKPVAEHLEMLQKAGMGAPRVAELVGLPTVTIWRTRTRSRRVLRRIGELILAVQPDNAADRAYIPSLGTTRRLQALVAIGYNLGMLSELCGRDQKALGALANGKQLRVTAAFARDVRGVFDRVQLSDGGCALSKARAVKRGWVPPLAWDECTIDDPDARPFGVRRVLKNVRRADRVEDYEEMRSWGLSDAQVAERMGVGKTYLMQLVSDVA